MSATNHTANYELSQYIGSDEPKYLTDYNGDMSKIDTAIKGVDTKAETANTGVATNASAISALDTAVGSLQTQVTTVAGVANGNTGSINTINSLIGNGEPTTQDKTIIGAINEIAAGATTPEASSVTFDKTGTDLNATNVQDAIEEVNAKIPQGGAVEADDVVYDNTSSGLTATDVQAAIDEVEGKISSMVIDLNLTNNVVATVTPASGVTIDDSSVNVLTNADASIGKIYGGLAFHFTSIQLGMLDVATITASNLPTIAEAYDIIFDYGILVDPNGVANRVPGKYVMHFNTDGSITIKYNSTGQTSVAMYGSATLAPCLYFLKDLGD